MQEKAENKITAADKKVPWVILKLYKSSFAVSSDYVSGICEIPDDEDIVPLPGCESYLTGAAVIRGTIVPLLDLRRFMGLPERSAEFAEFKEQIEQRKQDHIKWVDELKRCAESGDEFTLTRDPHACAFGKWLDNFNTDRNELKSHIEQIKKPHTKLHAMADEIFSNEIDEETKELLLYETEHFYMAKTLRLLDEAKEVFKSHFKGIVLLVKLSGEEKYIGLLADKVLSVENISVVFDKASVSRLYSSEYICGIAHSERTKGEIIMLDAEKMTELCPTDEDIIKAANGGED